MRDHAYKPRLIVSVYTAAKRHRNDISSRAYRNLWDHGFVTVSRNRLMRPIDEAMYIDRHTHDMLRDIPYREALR